LFKAGYPVYDRKTDGDIRRTKKDISILQSFFPGNKNREPGAEEGGRQTIKAEFKEKYHIR